MIDDLLIYSQRTKVENNFHFHAKGNGRIEWSTEEEVRLYGGSVECA